MKGIQIGKEEAKLSQFADNMIPYVENSKDAIKKLFVLVNEFSKVSGYKINIQKSAAFFNINNKLSEREIKKAIPIIIASKRVKCLGINLTKEAKDLYTEICKTLIKENTDTNKWEDSLCPWMEVINITKMSDHSKQATNSVQSVQWYFSQKQNEQF